MPHPAQTEGLTRFIPAAHASCGVRRFFMGHRSKSGEACPLETHIKYSAKDW